MAIVIDFMQSYDQSDIDGHIITEIIQIDEGDAGENEIQKARRVMREAFAEDEEFRKVYEDNIACWLMDNLPGLKRGQKAIDKRNEVARLILHNIFA